jgi:RNA polymerase sigma factor (sigma-70 family)
MEATVLQTQIDPREIMLAAAAPGAARDRLVARFQPLIGSVARSYRGAQRVQRDELMQEGVVGLLRALDRYEPQLGTPFWAYASWWVRQAMQRTVSELSGPMVLSDRAARQCTRIRRAQLKLLETHHREPTAREIAGETGMPADQVESLIASQRRPHPLDEPPGSDGDGGSAIGELVADPESESAYDEVEETRDLAELPEMLEHLSERERTIICGRYGVGGRELTLRELASTLGVSPERVRQIEQAALGKMRDGLAVAS